jgi:polysaccharide pyruvyl transferase WcaK-like protein
VFARDRISLRFLNEALGEDRAVLCPDLALMCQPEDPAIGRRLLSELGLSLEQPLLGLMPNYRCVEEGVTPLSDPTQYHRYLRRVVSWAEENGHQVVGISHMVGTDQDRALLNDLNIPIVRSDIPSSVRSVIANLDAAVCSRYHGLVNCLVHGVPPISLGWHHKYSGLMELFDLRDFDHPIEHDEGELVARLDSLFATRGQLEQHLRKKVDEARSEIQGCMRSVSLNIGSGSAVLMDPIVIDDTGIETLAQHRPTRFQKALRRIKRSLS